ncbi:MAG: hypothetical protein WA816_08625 [Bacteroidales bacterium]
MNKKTITFMSVVIILAFIVYMIIDIVKPAGSVNADPIIPQGQDIADAWKISGEFKVNEGSLKAVSVAPSGKIYLGGDSFVSCYDISMKLIWNVKAPYPVTSLTNWGDSIFASTSEQILVMSTDGRILNEWGPFEDSCLITSVAANAKYFAFADAGNKIVYVLDKGGEVKTMIGQNDKHFVIPSPYFEVALDKSNNLYAANTGLHRIETYTIDGVLKSQFGEAGIGPGAFCGCCAPPHFALIPQGFVTSEKGINRIKILNKSGEFVEYVNSKNNFIKSVPLALASADGVTIYAANPGDSKLYVFNRKTP